MANRVFQGTSNSDFNTAANWDGGATVPSAGDNIQISASCLLDANETNVYGTLLIDDTKTFDIATFNFNCGAITVTAGGKLKIGTSAGTGLTFAGLTCGAGTSGLDFINVSKLNNSGNWTTPASQVFTNNRRGAYKQIANGTITNSDFRNAFYTFTVNAGVTLTIGTNATLCDQNSHTFVNNGVIALGSGYCVMGASAVCTLGADSDFTGSASATLSCRFTNGLTYTNSKTGAFSFAGFLPQSNLVGTTGFCVTGNWGSAQYQIVGSASAMAFTFGAGTLTCSTFEIKNANDANISIDCSVNNPSVVVKGLCLFKNDAKTYTLTWTRGSGSWTLDGSSGTHSIDFQGKAIAELIGAASGTTKNILSNFSTVKLSGVFGTLQSSSAGTQRVITCTDQGVLTGGSFKDISLGSGSRCNAKSGCTNLGKNKGFVFKDTVMGCGE